LLAQAAIYGSQGGFDVDFLHLASAIVQPIFYRHQKA
jgi:hypothetical protein